MKFQFKIQGYQTEAVEDTVNVFRGQLKNYSFLISAAIHTQLRMTFPDLEKFNQKTVYNYVRRIRAEENIPKDSEGDNRPSVLHAGADFTGRVCPGRHRCSGIPRQKERGRAALTTRNQ